MLGTLACDCCSSWVEKATAKMRKTQLRGHRELSEGSAGGQLGNHWQEKKVGEWQAWTETEKKIVINGGGK